MKYKLKFKKSTGKTYINQKSKSINVAGGGGNDPEDFDNSKKVDHKKRKQKGSNMNIFLVTTIVLLVSACSIKKDQSKTNSVTNTLSIEEMTDSDGDGVPDSIELQRGTNPYIADIPRIRVSSVSEVAIGGTFRSSEEKNSYVSKDILLPQKFAETGDTTGADRDYLKALRKKVLANQVAQIRNIEADKEDLITNEDLRTSILSNWENEVFYKTLDSLLRINSPLDNETGKVSMSFKIKLNDTLGVSEVSNIKLKTFFYSYKKMEESDIYSHSLLKEDGSKEKINIYKDKEANPVTLYKIVSTDLNTSKIAESIKSRNEIGLKFTDYDYISSGISLNYSTVLQKTLDHDAKIIFSNGIKTEIFFVAPIFTLSEALNMLGKKVTKDAKGGIYSIDGIETNASLPIDFDTVSRKDYYSGVWSIVGNADALDDKLVEKGFYVVSYATIKDLIEANRSIQKYPESADTLSKSINLEKVIEGDELDFEVSSLRLKTITENLSRETRDETPEDRCKFTDIITPMTPPGRIGKGCNNLIENELTCEIIKSSATEEDQEINFDTDYLKKNLVVLNDMGDTVDFSSYFAKNSIHIGFNKQLPLQRNNLKIFFKAPQEKISARNGVIRNTCKGGQESYSTINYVPSILFKKDASVYTQTKY